MITALKTSSSNVTNSAVRGFTFTDYLIVFAAIMVVSPFFSTTIHGYSLVALLFTIIVALKRRVRIIDQRIFFILTAVYFLILVQWFQFGGLSYAMLYYPLIVFYWPFLLFSLYGKGMIKLFIDVMYAIAIFTLPFWLMQSLSSQVDSLLRELAKEVFPFGWDVIPRSLLFYTSAWSTSLMSDTFGMYRNSGLFHEPGAYATFLYIALIMNTYLSGKLVERKSVVLFFCILTTFSTAAYIGLFVFFISLILRKKTNMALKVLLIVGIVLIAYQSYMSLDFLGTKISEQFNEEIVEVQQQAGVYEGTRGRFFAFLTTFQFFKENPLFGRGIVQITGIKQAGLIHEKASTHFGPLAVLAYYGIFAGVFYLINIYFGLKALLTRYNSKLDYTSITFLALMAVLSTQAFILTTIMVYIFVIGLYEKKEQSKTILG